MGLAFRLTRLLSSLPLGRVRCALMAWVVSWTPASASVWRGMALMLLWVTSRAASGAVRRVFTRSRPFEQPTDGPKREVFIMGSVLWGTMASDLAVWRPSV